MSTPGSAAEVPLAPFARVVVVTFVAGVPTLLLTRFGMPAATVWMANILAIVLILREQDAARGLALAGAGVGIFAANLFVGNSALVSAGFSLANLLEIGISSELLRSRVGPWRWSPAQFLRALPLALGVGPLVSACAGALVLRLAFDVGWWTGLWGWYSSQAAATLVILPAAWTLQTIERDEPAQAWHASAVWTLTLLIAVAVFGNKLLPLLFLPAVPLVLFDMLGMPRQGVLAMLFFNACAVVATHAGWGPVSLIPTEDDVLRAAVLQAYLLTLGVITIPTGWRFMTLQATLRSLEASEGLATRANHAKSEFLATMSHELRTPVAGVVGHVEALKDTPLSAAQLRYLERIEIGMVHLRRVIGDVLDLSQIEAGRLELQPTPVDLRRLADACVGLVAGQLTEDVTGQAVVEVDVPRHVRVDEARLQQVLMNLLNNAAKFTKAGTVMLQVRPLDGSAGWLELLVRDTGCGIPAEDLDHVRERFRQSAQGRGRAHGGSGLGLSIADQIVQAMGGELLISSSLGFGTIVSVRLPLVACEPPAQPEPGEGASAVAFEPLGLRVLFVEDDPIMSELGVAQLRLLGCEVLSYLDPKLAAREAPGLSFDLLLSDLHMPGMDGFGLLRRLRRHRPGLPALLMTADATPQARQIALVAGFRHVLVKPISRAELRAALADEALLDAAAEAPERRLDLDEDALRDMTLVVGEEELQRMLSHALDRFGELLLRLRAPDVELADVLAIAHQLRGTAGTLGMRAVQGQATLLEDSAAAGDTLGLHLDALEGSVEDTRAALAALGFVQVRLRSGGGRKVLRRVPGRQGAARPEG